MAKTAKPKTKAGLAADAAREAYTAAKEKHGKTPTEQTKKALEHALAARNAAEKVENRERFETLAGGRVGKTLAVLDTLKQCANRKSYEFTALDVAGAMNAIRAKVDELDKLFAAALATPVAASDKKAAPKVFKFGA